MDCVGTLSPSVDCGPTSSMMGVQSQLLARASEFALIFGKDFLTTSLRTFTFAILPFYPFTLLLFTVLPFYRFTLFSVFPFTILPRARLGGLDLLPF